MSSPKNLRLLLWGVVAPTAGGALLRPSCLLLKNLRGARGASSILPFASARRGSSSSREGKSSRAGPEWDGLLYLSDTMGKSLDRRWAGFWRSSVLLVVAVDLLMVFRIWDWCDYWKILYLREFIVF